MLSEQQHAGKAFTRSDWFFFNAWSQDLYFSVQSCKPVCSTVREEGRRDLARPWLSPGAAASNGSLRGTVVPRGRVWTWSRGAQGGGITPGSSPGLHERLRAPAAEGYSMPGWRTSQNCPYLKGLFAGTAAGMSEILSKGHILPWRLSLLQHFSLIFQEKNNSMIISPPQLSWVTYIIRNYFLTCVFAKQITETMKSNETWYARRH